jgi:NADH-quinone oxidoreductase subunit H
MFFALLYFIYPSAADFLMTWVYNNVFLMVINSAAIYNSIMPFLIGLENSAEYYFFQELVLVTKSFYQLIDIVIYVICYVLFFFGFLLSIAYVVLLERKLIATIQRRKGPNKVGFFGLLQPLADGMKLLLKEYIFPKKANKYIFIFVSLLTFVVSFILLSLLEFSFWSTFVYSRYNILIILGILSLNTLFIPLAGWASHSRYGFLGGIRDIAQIISYELSLTTLLLIIFFVTKDISIYSIVEFQIDIWNVFFLFPLYLLFIIVFLAKLNRVPFDLPEGEAELVAGFNVEYSSFIFALFFLGEYGNIFFISTLSSILFFGGWLPFKHEDYYFYGMIFFIIKIVLHVYFIIWVRATLPRYRYDQLIKLGWKYLLPIIFFFLIVYFTLDLVISFPQEII